MKHISPKFLLSAVLSTVSFGSWAAPITLETMNFDAQGLEASGNGVPVEVDTVLGVYFSNAFVFDRSMIEQFPPEGSNPAPDIDGTQGGFVANRSQTSNAAPLRLSLLPISGGASPLATKASPTPSAIQYPGQFFQSVALRLFSAGDVIVSAYSLGTLVAPIDLIGGTPTLQFWSDVQTLSFTESQRIDTLVFSAGMNGDRQLGIDDLSITLTGTSGGGGGGNVPEPASYGLVMLALLAAGAATHRKAARKGA